MASIAKTKDINKARTIVRQSYTLSFILDTNKILLGMKKRGFGQGKRFRGKFHFSADEKQVLSYELKEISGLPGESLGLLPAA